MLKKQIEKENYKIVKKDREIIETVHNITPRDAIFVCFAYLHPIPFFFLTYKNLITYRREIDNFKFNKIYANFGRYI